ncbi:MAG: amidohydrolase family protein [Pseudomonadota bacterium]
MIKALLKSTAAATLAALATPTLADTLVDNVEGITIGEDGKLKRFTGLIFNDEGIITQTLERGEERPQTDYGIDGEGRVMLPGMIDAHVHVMDLGFAALTLDLSDTTSLEEALALIKAFSEENEGRPWILGRGWNQEKWGLGRFPTAAELDAVVPDRPVWLKRADNHANWANSRAMELAGITANTPDVAGGLVIRDASGAPTGVFVDNAKALVENAVSPPRPSDRDAAFAKAQDRLLAYGVTAVADMRTTMEDWQTFRRAGDTGTLRMRIVSYAVNTETMELIGGPGPTPWLYEDRLRLNGIHLLVDGALGSRGALLLKPYKDKMDQMGLPLLSPTELRNLMSRAALDNFQTAIHAIGDAANRDVLLAIEELSDTYSGDRRWRVEHAQIVDPTDLKRFGRYGTIASMQPLQQASDMGMVEARLGEERLGGAYAWRSILNASGRLAFGSGSPVEPADPFAGLATAISRTDENGEPFGGWQAQEVVSRTEALKAYTADPAYAGFAEGRYGRLVPGERADFLLVDRDPFLSSPEQIRETQIHEVWVDGRKALQN